MLAAVAVVEWPWFLAQVEQTPGSMLWLVATIVTGLTGACGVLARAYVKQQEKLEMAYSARGEASQAVFEALANALAEVRASSRDRRDFKGVLEQVVAAMGKQTATLARFERVLKKLDKT